MAAGANKEAMMPMKLWLPYNVIFSRHQIFTVLSRKHGDYFSRILILAVGNVREKSF